jgi:hypothetical protein
MPLWRVPIWNRNLADWTMALRLPLPFSLLRRTDKDCRLELSSRTRRSSALSSPSGFILTLSIELVTDVTNHFTLNPTYAVIIDRDHEQALIQPAVPFHCFVINRIGKIERVAIF